MTNDTLSLEEQKEIDAWNLQGSEITDSTMRSFLPSWFANIRALIRSGIEIQSLELLTSRYDYKKSIIILGSGPSAVEITQGLKRTPDMMLLCGPTCLGTVLAASLRPDIVVVADSNVQQYEAVRDLDPDDIAQWHFALPITASSAWYDKQSILSPSQLYFYLPFMDFMGSGDLAYNDIQSCLFPEIHRYIKQAGSVGNTMMGISEMLCGEDASKRVYLGIDCCGWMTKIPKKRAPAAVKKPDGTYEMITSDLQKIQNEQASVEALYIKTPCSDLETNIISLGYALQMLFLVHQFTRSADRADRYIMLAESSRLFTAISPEIIFPRMDIRKISPWQYLLSTEDWAYNSMLDFIRVSNRHAENLRKGVENAKS